MGCGASTSGQLAEDSSAKEGSRAEPESTAPAVEAKVVPVEPKTGVGGAPSIEIVTVEAEKQREVPSSSSVAKRRLVTKADIEDVQNLLSSKVVKGSLHEPASLVDVDAIREFAPGSVIAGEDAWGTGRLLVLSGRASIVGSCEQGKETQLASLQPGSIFGWKGHPDHPHHPPSPRDLQHSISHRAELRAPSRVLTGTFLFELSWESLRARIIVDHGLSLRVCELDGAASDFIGGVCQKFSKSLCHDNDDCCRHLADLWESTSPPIVGIGTQPAGSLRAQFLTGLWGQLRDVLEAHDDEIRRRKRRGYRTNDQFPLQGHQIGELKEYVFHLTEVWYGSSKGGNLSVFFRWFMNTMDLVQVTAYVMDDIPTETTSDGWAVVVDGGARAKALKSRGNQDATHVATGGLKQKQGRSAIDNTVLVNVFSGLEARVLLIGRRLRKVICRLISIRQTCILRRLSRRVQMNLANLASETCTGRDHRIVRSILRALSPEDFAASGIDPESFCFRELLAKGSLISGFGQLEPKDQVRVWDLCSGYLCPKGITAKDVAPKEGSDDVFDKFVLWSRNNPGDFFEKDKNRHFEVLIGGMWCNRIVLVKRSAMERMTLARYFALSWKRTQPLWAAFGSTANQLREAGTKEASRVRANECPYARFHGMSLPSGGFALDERKAKRADCKIADLMNEMQWVHDPSANIENWFLTDIEKILQECWQLNPHGPPSMILPGEMFVNVGQNPKVGSSIKQTQHTQICEGSILNYPILQVTSPEGPKKSSKLCNAWLDLIDIGPHDSTLIPEDLGFFIKISCTNPTQPAIVGFLVDLRLRLLANFGGAEVLDFLVTAVSDGKGCFVILFAPIPHLEKIGPEPPDLATWANPTTGESSESAGIEEARLDFGKGVGQFLVNKPALREQLLKSGEDTMRRIWAFNRVPGLREFVHQFTVEQNIFD